MPVHLSLRLRRTTTPVVMDASYARKRRESPALGFRLRSRAQVVIRAWKKYGGQGSPRILELGAAEGRTLVEISRQIGPGRYV